ncbi:sulfatase-like hydrolase/transferase [Nocardioides sp. GXQ0305]|uniref:sulfatase-like hydrolase/transferase n=1 Tax=Nocardioides sp. GXQ0305 TaxID=3423912 RepID=UPI003D7E3892
MRAGWRSGVVAALLPALVAGCGVRSGPPADAEVPAPREAPQERLAGHPMVPDRTPNIVLVLMDDLSTDLVQTMSQAHAMAREGASWEHSYVVDSLCCVSRSSLLTGQYPHQTGVLTNTANTPNALGPLGGWEAFAAYGNEQRAVNVRLRQAGWTTGYVGKFLNQYEPLDGVAPPVPPGWSEWVPVFGSAYDGWEFDLLDAGPDGAVLEHVEAPPAWASEAEKDAAYAGNVIADRAVEFVRQHRDDERPYFLTVATYGTHSRIGDTPHYPGDPGFPPALADRAGPGRAGNCGPVSCGDLTAADLPGFGDDQADNAPRRLDGSLAPQWRPPGGPVDPGAAAFTLRARAQMAQSIDRMVARLRAEVGPDTYVVLTSDNGFHVDQHGLGRGKGTPFDSDVRVPLLVTGPGVAPGPRPAVVSNVDLAPTLEELAGLPPASFRAGTSLVPSLHDPTLDRRGYAFFEHTWGPSLGLDPDAAYAGGTMDLIPSYVAVRSRDALLVRFDLDPSWDGVDHAYELYDYRDDGWERTNVVADPARRGLRDALLRRLEAFVDCRTVTRDDTVPERCRRLTSLGRLGGPAGHGDGQAGPTAW